MGAQRLRSTWTTRSAPARCSRARDSKCSARRTSRDSGPMHARAPALTVGSPLATRRRVFAVFFPNVSRAQKTYTVAMALLGAVAATQILVALYLYTKHAREASSIAMRTAVEARLFDNARVTPTPMVGPVTVPAVAGVPQATVRRVQARPTSVAD